jgi:hypothetical protein
METIRFRVVYYYPKHRDNESNLCVNSFLVKELPSILRLNYSPGETVTPLASKESGGVVMEGMPAYAFNSLLSLSALVPDFVPTSESGLFVFYFSNFSATSSYLPCFNTH